LLDFLGRGADIRSIKALRRAKKMETIETVKYIETDTPDGVRRDWYEVTYDSGNTEEYAWLGDGDETILDSNGVEVDFPAVRAAIRNHLRAFTPPRERD
jgi:hypothetical protein